MNRTTPSEFPGFSQEAVEIALKSPLVLLSRQGQEPEKESILEHEQPEHPDIGVGKAGANGG